MAMPTTAPTLLSLLDAASETGADEDEEVKAVCPGLDEDVSVLTGRSVLGPGAGDDSGALYSVRLERDCDEL